jgi:RNA-directed DNA polymerase
MVDQLRPQRRGRKKPQPLRRTAISKPGRAKKRSPARPVMLDRAYQHLVKQALEPEWEAKFEPHTYGFRPGRSCHDAIAAISMQINKKATYVLHADLQGCFDTISHEALLHRLQTYPAMKHILRAWLRAGLIEKGVFEETPPGTPQGGVLSPFVANIALHGMEIAVKAAFTHAEGKPDVVRYAHDVVVFHPTEQGVLKARAVVASWIKAIGLAMKPSKARITHTLQQYQGRVGFDFLGWTVRQFPVGKTHTGKGPHHGRILGFKTIIRPGKEAEKRHTAHLGEIIHRNLNASQGQLIRELNPVIQRWTHSYKTVGAGEVFQRCRYHLFQQLQEWGRRRHPNKGKRWIANKYWHVEEGKGWNFSDGTSILCTHDLAHIQRYTSVEDTASPYKGDMLYWSQRLSKHPLPGTTRGKTLQKQAGKCQWCGLFLCNNDLIEGDDSIPQSQGGGEELRNTFALHRDCHDKRHARRVVGTCDKGQIVEEPDAGKLARPVLQTSRRGDSLA